MARSLARGAGLTNLGSRLYFDEFRDAARTPLSSWSAGLAFDPPRARKLHMQWSDIDQFIVPIQTDLGAVLAWDMSDELYVMLALALDRHVLRGGEPGTSQARWLVAARDHDVPSGLVPHRGTTGCGLRLFSAGSAERATRDE